MIEGEKYYIVDGKRIHLNRVESARYVSPAKDYNLIHVGARLAESSRLGIDTEFHKDHLVVRGDPKKLEEIRDYPDVQYTRSVFTDENGFELVLTNDVLVKFADDIGIEARHELIKKMNCVVIDTDEIWRIRVLDTDDDAPLDVANRLSEEKGVIYAEPDALVKTKFFAVAPPADTLFPNQWHLRNIGQGGGTPGADVKALDAWETTYGSSKIRVVIFDTGVDMNHPDLKANIEPGWDFDNNDSDASPDPNYIHAAHGTACAGVVAASINGQGVVGIAPGCKIVPLRGIFLTFQSTADAFEWAAEHGDIISCSWGQAASNTVSLAIKKVAKGGRNGKGVPIFVATGNSANTNKSPPISYPASLLETIAVGASTNLDVRADYSQYGNEIDFVAPSNGGTRRIETTDIQGAIGYNKNASTKGDYCKADDKSGFGGTSSATPLAAGVAALMLSVNPALTAKDVRKILRENCVKIDQANANYDANGWSQEYGYGRIDAGRAVQAAAALLSGNSYEALFGGAVQAAAALLSGNSYEALSGRRV